MRHDFNLNGTHDAPGIAGIDGVLQTYKDVMASGIMLSGPTCFAPIIRKVSAEAKTFVPGSQYNVLLIITDGEIPSPSRSPMFALN